MPVIQFQNVDLGYKNRPILRSLNGSIERGDSLGIVGPNGSGKTTLLKAALGIIPPLSGSVHVDPSYRFAYVPQTESLNLELPLTIRETVQLCLRSRRAFGRITSEEKDAAQWAMERVGVAKIANQTLRDCSGGQRQKTILAQALSQRPDVLLLDEPTKGLDVAAEHDVLNLIETLKEEQNLTILFVTHVLHIPLNFMKRLLIISQGVGVFSTPEDLVQTHRLEEIYGVPFVLGEAKGVRWAMPLKAQR